MKIILLRIIILLIIVILSIIFVKIYKGDKINKILILLVGLTVIGAVIFLVFFPSENLNDKEYFMGIAQLVGGLFTVIGVYFTIKEEEKIRQIDEKSADNKIKEQLRLENLPVLKFSFDNEKKSHNGSVDYVNCASSNDNYKVQLNIEIKNVGLGSAQNIWFQTIIGIQNDDSKSGIENQIIEPKETINYTVYFEIPKNNRDFYKRLTILVFYDDLLENKYMQKLDGSLSISSCESNGICEYYPDVFVSVNEKYVKIGTDFKYEIPQEIIEEEVWRSECEEKLKKTVETIPEKGRIDEIVGEYLNEQKYLIDIVRGFFKTIDFSWGGRENEDYKMIRKNIYDVTIIEETGVNRKEYIKCETILRVNTKTEEIRCIDKKIIKSTLNISKRELNRFKKQLNKEVKEIKKIEEKIYK